MCELNINQLLLAYHQTKDIKTRNLIAKHYLYLTSKLVNKHFNHVDINLKEDLEQESALELLDAIDDYNPNKGAEFITFAYTRIVGRIKQFMRDKAWLVKIPQKLYVLNGKISRTKKKLFDKLNREPTSDELLNTLGITVEEFQEAQSAICHLATMISTSEYDISLICNEETNIDFEEETIYPNTYNKRSMWQKIANESSSKCKPKLQ